jgi:G3E family GTPase
VNERPDQRIPVTVLTGFLGAGKTTLLNRILSESHGRRIAVIENEFGPEGIDSEILVREPGEQIVEMNNGCVCCTVRGDLVRILGELRAGRDSGRIQFERVVIETTGMANPGPVAQTFFVDEDVGRHYQLDGVITVVDALHGDATLDRQPEAQAQVGFADRILLSKTDLVPATTTQALRERLVRMNPRATIHEAEMGHVPVEVVLDVDGFRLDAILEIDPGFLASARAQAAGGHGHVHDHDHDGGHSHGQDGHSHADGEHCGHCDDPSHGHAPSRHDDEIRAFVYEAHRPFDPRLLDETFEALTQVYGPDLLRYKGVLFVRGSGRRLVLQGVHMLMGIEPGRPWGRQERPSSRIVFIGRRLPQEIFVQGLEASLVR